MLRRLHAAAHKATQRAPLSRRLRQLHLYLGVVFAPVIVFFAFSGALQVLGLHEPVHGTAPPAWISQLSTLHKHQRLMPRLSNVPLRTTTRRDQQTIPVVTQILEAYTVVAALSLLLSTLIGLYLGFQT